MVYEGCGAHGAVRDTFRCLIDIEVVVVLVMGAMMQVMIRVSLLLRAWERPGAPAGCPDKHVLMTGPLRSRIGNPR